MFWFWAACPWLGLAIGWSKNRKFAGFLLGLFFGPIGLFVTAFLDGRRACPRCTSRINGQAAVCAACGARLAWSGGEAFARPDDYDEAAAVEAAARAVDPIPRDWSPRGALR